MINLVASRSRRAWCHGNLIDMHRILNERIRELTVVEGNRAALVHHLGHGIASKPAYHKINRDGARFDALILGSRKGSGPVIRAARTVHIY